MFLRREHLSVIIFAGLLAAGSGLSVSGQGRAQPGGQELFAKRCGGCHALDRDKEGPRLGGVYGRPAGSLDSFQYSDALKKSGITWDERSLEKWLTDPAQLVPSTEMTFHLDKPEERREIISYLKQSSGR